MKAKILDCVRELAPVILLAAFGGFTRTVANKEEHFSIRRAIAEIVIAIFCGLLIHWVLQSFEVAEHIRTAAVALAGYSSRCVLAIIHSAFLSKIKLIAQIFGGDAEK